MGRVGVNIMKSGTSFNRTAGQRSHDAGTPWAIAGTLVDTEQNAASTPTRGIGALATRLRELARDSIYVTFDALCGRYDR